MDCIAASIGVANVLLQKCEWSMLEIFHSDFLNTLTLVLVIKNRFFFQKNFTLKWTFSGNSFLGMRVFGSSFRLFLNFQMIDDTFCCFHTPLVFFLLSICFLFATLVNIMYEWDFCMWSGWHNMTFSWSNDKIISNWCRNMN